MDCLERFEIQLANFQREEKAAKEWRGTLSKTVPRDIINIIDDYSNEHFQTRTWYIAACQASMNFFYSHSVSTLDQLEIMKRKPADKLTREEKAEIVWIAHQVHNENLLRGSEHPGCTERGVDCSDNCQYCGEDSEEPCTWTYGEHRCVCGNYKGFKWEIDDYEDWITFSLFSQEPLGRQVRMW